MRERIEAVAPESGRLDAILSGLVPDLSRSRAAALIKDGAVRVGEVEIRRPAHRVTAGERVSLDVPDLVPTEAVAQDLPLDIAYEDADIVVVDKRAGVVVHPAAGHPDGTLVNALLHHVGDLSGIGGVQRPGIVHRLDRGTSGLMVVAKHDRAHHRLSEQFAEKTAGRRYLAVCMGQPAHDAGTIRTTLARHPKDRMRWASTEDGSGKEAITHWRVVGRAGTLTLFECRLETGRTHQIRVHLTEQGWPLLGDPVYKRRDRRPPASVRDLVVEDRPMLHAWQLTFEHPTTGARMTFTAPPPPDFRAILDALGLEPPPD